MITLPSQASLSVVKDRFDRLIAAASGAFPPEHGAPLADDPVFLPDFMTWTPDQAQELRYGQRRDHE